MRATMRQLLFGAAVGLAVLLVPTLAVAAEEAAEAAVPWQATASQVLSAAMAMSFSALAAGYAQAKIGSAGVGTLAERPEAATTILVLQALPEIIALLGFAIAFLILNS